MVTHDYESDLPLDVSILSSFTKLVTENNKCQKLPQFDLQSNFLGVLHTFVSPTFCTINQGKTCGRNHRYFVRVISWQKEKYGRGKNVTEVTLTKKCWP